MAAVSGKLLPRKNCGHPRGISLTSLKWSRQGCRKVPFSCSVIVIPNPENCLQHHSCLAERNQVLKPDKFVYYIKKKNQSDFSAAVLVCAKHSTTSSFVVTIVLATGPTSTFNSQSVHAIAMQCFIMGIYSLAVTLQKTALARAAAAIKQSRLCLNFSSVMAIALQLTIIIAWACVLGICLACLPFMDDSITLLQL
jgi:hypothetical protein